jgi:hypothetical protein
MPVIFQKMIYRADLRANPMAFYLFGDNDARQGYGGQAKEMRDEPNAIGVRTKWRGSMEPSAFFRDVDFVKLCRMIEEDLAPAFAWAERGRVLVVPLDGLGTGLSRLPETAPLVLEFLNRRLAALAAK